ncbi:hypothetical protein SAMN05216464_1353 [Mucilaginibacter pineti]|uniref:Transposase n=1 Tax=Mucilaginibacter pineti TaxID=1391627 RepID=A0A1G7P567_9SPHI|nr:hypothetical protein [Mucilaginibacter pineti]SDF81413.1 hypothetical protein SAMN05216464_1353 [Mucilaginibacter pineti]
MENKHIILTRKIQLLLNSDDAAFRKDCFTKLYDWQWICFRAANYIFTHHYVQEQIKEFIYITDEVKVKLADIKKDEDGILTTSKANTTYQLLSKYFKGEIPMDFISCLNHTLVSNYNNERVAYWKGEKSLRNYKRDIPLPFSAKQLKFIPMEKGREYQLTLFQIPFRTYLGKDRTDKSVLLKRAIAGNLKISSCALKLDKGKIFLLASFQMDKEANQLDSSVIAEASLSLEFPITLKIGRSDYRIGSKEEFLHRRIALQNARRRLQIGSTFNRSGQGRKRKLKSVEAYKDHEKKYVDYKLHVYSRRLIDLCVKHQAATLLLINQEQKEEVAKEDEFLLRNWSYYGLKEKIEYKANKAGITLISE